MIEITTTCSPLLSIETVYNSDIWYMESNAQNDCLDSPHRFISDGIALFHPHTSSVFCVYMCMARRLFPHWRPAIRRPLPCPPCPRQTGGTCSRPHFSKPPNYMHTAPSRTFQPTIAIKLRHPNLLCLMAGGRTKYTLTNTPCNEPLPGFLDSDEKTLPRRYDLALLVGSSD